MRVGEKGETMSDQRWCMRKKNMKIGMLIEARAVGTNNKKKRNLWKDKEVGDMLSIINEKHIMQLLDNKVKRNKNIFEEISEELRKKGCFKTGVQVRAKFKALKSDFFKAKRSNNKSGAQRHTCEYFEVLNQVLGDRPVLTATGVDTSQVEINEPSMELDLETYSPLSETDIELLEMTSQVAEKNTSHDSSQSAVKSTLSTFKNSKKRTYERVVESFSKEWKATQEEMLKTTKEQDQEYMENVEKMLEKNRTETALLLEADRQETSKMLMNFINMMHPQSTSYGQLFQPNFFPQMLNATSGTAALFTTASPPNTPPNVP